MAPGSRVHSGNRALKDLASDSTFPNAASAVAEMRPHSLTIHLHNVSHMNFVACNSQRNFEELGRQQAVICHEITHWHDLVSTVWGQEYLIKLFDAYHCVLNRDRFHECNFAKLVELYDEDRRVLFPRYYRVVERPNALYRTDAPWSIDFSCALEFSPDGRLDPNRPLFMTSFGMNPGRERIARQPISTGTLLETTATASELLTELAALHQIADEDEKMVALRLWRSRTNAIFHDPSNVQYSAPVHMLSARTGTNEPILTYQIAASLAFICLNLTESHFNQLRIPPNFEDSFPQRRLAAFRAAQDRGFAFACVVFNAPNYKEVNDAKQWLELALSCANLPASPFIQKAAFERLLALQHQPRRWMLDDVRDELLELGRGSFMTRSLVGVPAALTSLVAARLEMPPMFDSTGELFDFFESKLVVKHFDAIMMFDREWDMKTFMGEFLPACRGALP